MRLFLTLLFQLTAQVIFAQSNYVPCSQEENTVSADELLVYLKDFFSHESDSNNWSIIKKYEYKPLTESNYYSHFKSYKTNQLQYLKFNDITSIPNIGSIYKRDSIEYFKVRFKREYNYDENNILFIRNVSSKHWSIIPYTTPTQENLLKIISTSVFIDIEDVSGSYCSHSKMELDKIGELTYNAIFNQTSDKLYCQLGITHRNSKIIYPKWIDTIPSKHINNLIEKRETIINDSKSVYRRLCKTS